MSGRKRRDLRPDEKELWSKVAKTTEPLHQPARKPKTSAAALTAPKKLPKVEVPRSLPISAEKERPKTQVFHAPDIGEDLAGRPVAMDQRAYGKMKRGKMKPEGRIDLHGMTLAQAHPVLDDFVRRSHAQGKRLLLVITGKGKDRDDGNPIPQRVGVLRHQVPLWLSQGGLGPLVLQVTPASQNYGGNGAYFVFLRRNRK